MNVQGMGRDQVFLTMLPDGDAGTAQTIFYARQLVAEGLANPDVRRLALYYVNLYQVPPHDKLGELQAIFAGVLRDFQYRDDPAIVVDGGQPEGAELLQPLRGLLQTRAGDCDDLNLILVPALLGSLGFRMRGVTIKADSERPDEFSHVYSEAFCDGQWIPMDVARVNPGFGKAPEYYWARQNWPLTGSPKTHLNGFAARKGRGMGILAQRRFPRRGLGQDTTDTTDTYDSGFDEGYQAAANVQQGPTFSQSLLAAAPSLLQGVAQVTKAANTPGIAYTGVGTSSGTTTPGFTVSAGASSGLYVLGALIVLGVLAYSAKR